MEFQIKTEFFLKRFYFHVLYSKVLLKREARGRRVCVRLWFACVMENGESTLETSWIFFLTVYLYEPCATSCYILGKKSVRSSACSKKASEGRLWVYKALHSVWLSLGRPPPPHPIHRDESPRTGLWLWWSSSSAAGTPNSARTLFSVFSGEAEKSGEIKIALMLKRVLRKVALTRTQRRSVQFDFNGE